MCTFFSYVSVRECINPCSEAHALLARSMNYTCFFFFCFSSVRISVEFVFFSSFD